MDRRAFLSSASALAALAAAAPLRGQASSKPRRRVGLIGCGWFGGVDLLRLSQAAPIDVVSLCDVDGKALENTLALVATFQATQPKTYRDYRRMLAPRDLDIVIVATPDHWHALPALAAIEAGADVYLEKPVGVDVIEGEALVAAARKRARVVQVGTQRRSMPHIAEARERFVRTGKLGRIGLVEGYCYFRMRSKDAVPDTQPPASLDYELWTGPAPARPFTAMTHPIGWRNFMEYGNGAVGDLCVHQLDTARWMLGLGWPKSVSSSGGILVDTGATANISDTQVATFDFGETQFVWQHRSWGAAPDPTLDWTRQWGLVLRGERGSLRVTSVDYDFTPNGEGDPIHRDALNESIDAANANYDAIDRAAGPAERRHMVDFLSAIDRRAAPVADIEEGHISSASCILANLSLQLGRSLAYDPLARAIPGDAEATALLRRPYRAPWIHPEPDAVST